MLRASLSIAALIAAGSSVDASPVAPRAAASIPQAVGQYAYKGCYTDLPNGVRVLPISLATSSRSVDACVDAAKKGGYKLAGIEYYGECWVGNELDSRSTLQSDDKCNLVCWGDSTQFCGGQGGPTGAVMQLYSLPAVTASPANNATNTTTSPTVTSSAVPIATPTFVKSYSSASTKWTRESCQSDLRYGTRALSNRLASPKKRTVEGCLDECTSAGYSLCGVEWDGECWGANSLDKTSITLDDTACNKVCADDATEICGGTGGESGSAFQLYNSTVAATNTTSTTSAPTASATAATGLKEGGEVVKTVNSEGGRAWSNNGCYGDLKYGTRALSHLFAEETDLTVESCVNACQNAGYSLCGLEYQGECWGGNSIDSTSSKIDASVCNLACTGNNSQRCGGSQAAGTPGIAPFGASFQLYAQCGDNVATCTLTEATSCSGEYVLYDGKCDSTTCPDGWFNEDQVCKQCNSVDKTCTSLTKALSCVEGHVLYKDSCSLTSCPEATFEKDAVCYSCGDHAKSCESETKATLCYDKFFLSESSCVADCGAGRFGDSTTGKCASCSEGASACTSATVATQCSTGYFLTKDSTCTKDCGSAFVGNAQTNKCDSCPSGAISCSSSTVATKCSPTLFLKNGACVSSCGQGFYGSGADNSCTACGSGVATCSASGAASCQSGYFLTPSGTCATTCPDNLIADSVTKKCIVSDYVPAAYPKCQTAWGRGCDGTGCFGPQMEYIYTAPNGQKSCKPCEYWANRCNINTGKTTLCASGQHCTNF
ncbi:hypothetical protein JCM6882_004747 [Rhodosporidiobolus microsporus]